MNIYREKKINHIEVKKLGQLNIVRRRKSSQNFVEYVRQTERTCESSEIDFIFPLVNKCCGCFVSFYWAKLRVRVL